MILLNSEQIASLDVHPEYRMGYHKVHACIDGRGYEFGYILNQTVFLREQENPWQMRFGWTFLLEEAAKSRQTITFFRVIPREPETLRGVRQIAINQEKWGSS